MLRCDGCEVLYHPACWVRNEGCATAAPHAQSPTALAYSGGRPIGGEARHPGEGTRVLDPARSAVPPQWFARQREAPQRQVRDHPSTGDDEPVIGEFEVEPSERQPSIGSPQARRGAQSRGQVPYRPTPPRRYDVPAEAPSVRQPLPKVYGRHRALDYWYVPVAVALAVVVAFGVIWVADSIFGGGEGDNQADSNPPAASPSVANQSPAATSATPPRTPSNQTPAAAGTFQPGDVVVVSGSGECLNVRPEPGLANEPVACLPDGTEFKILSGPQSNEGLTWWKVQTAQGDGWAAEDYLVRQQ